MMHKCYCLLIIAWSIVLAAVRGVQRAGSLGPLSPRRGFTGTTSAKANRSRFSRAPKVSHPAGVEGRQEYRV